MSAEPAHSIRRNSLVLGAFCLGVALLLALVNLSTRERIAEQQLQAQRRALAQVFPAQYHDNDLLASAFTLDASVDGFAAWNLIDVLQITEVFQGYIATRDGRFTGAILPVQSHTGYSGTITLLVGIMDDGTITGVRVLEHRETPGLGDKIDIEVSDWILAFNGKSLGNPPQSRWQVVKDGGDFDGLVGATITPRAVVDAVKRALDFFELNKTLLANRAN